jgi:putative phage-type endonuclease
MSSKDRQKMIGGSDVAAVLGLSRWKTPLQLWAEKSGELEAEDISGKEYVQLGIELEDFVAKKFEKETGKKVRRDRREFQHPSFPYMVAHIDRRIQGEDEILECKTCSAWKAKEWEGEEIPMEYILQCQWYMGITGKSKCYLAVLIGGQKFVWKELTLDQGLFLSMVSAVQKFWEMVEKKVPPAAMSGDKDVLGKLFREDEGSAYEPTESEMEEINNLMSHRQDLQLALESVKTEIEECENKVKEKIGACSQVETDRFKISWKTQTRRSVDGDKLKEAGIWDQYVKTSVSRVFRVAQKKEGKDGKGK